ncbi:protein NETWORKED 3C [Argentina anserina]|uniref:protein NETWORKED 3C n=1 Tax=Argentina anserina TaxID=57926 RepID=UPI00217671EC|nr:protein NETWORKED 3C [Potentilla anserina]
MMKKQQQASHYWLFDSRSNSTRTPWLQSTLAELEKNTDAMLQLIQEDADSFAQRAEMYYKKRPQLIGMVEEFYRAHRSLAERYDLVKSDSGTRLLTTLGSPFSTKCHSEKSMSVVDETYDSLSETCDPEEYTESEVDDPEIEDETPVNKATEGKVSCRVSDDEVRKLKEEIERLQEENTIQQAQLKQKDDEKREVIRQLSVAVDVYKQENVKLRKYLARELADNSSPFFEFNKLKATFLGKLFNRSPKSHTPIVAL